MMPLALADMGSENIIRHIGGSPEVRKHLEDTGLCGRRHGNRGVRPGRQPHCEGEGGPGSHQRRNGKKNYDIRRRRQNENTEGC